MTLMTGGPDGVATPVGPAASRMTRPSWAPAGTEVWTVLDSTQVTRVQLDGAGAPRTDRVDAAPPPSLGPVAARIGGPAGAPLLAVAAAPNRPVRVTDQGGVWSFAGGDLETWRQVVGGVPDAVPLYPG